MNLTEIDCKVLGFFSDREEASLSEAARHLSFDEETMKSILEDLSLPSFSDRIAHAPLIHIYKDDRGNSSRYTNRPLYETWTYQITPYGKRLFRDWKEREKNRLKAEFLSYGTFLAAVVSAIASIIGVIYKLGL